MPQWKVGLIGCGRMGRAHAQAYAQHPRFTLTAAMDPVADWRTTESLLELLAGERLDVISLCSPTAWHAAQAVDVLSSPTPPRILFIEKPVCRTAEELRRVEQLARHTGVKVLVNHTRRFDSAHQRVAALVQSGTLGELLSGRWTYYGGWLNIGVHLIDTLRMLFAEALRLESSLASGSGRGDDHNLDVTARLGGARLHIEAVDEAHYQLFDCEFRFERGRVQLLDMGTRIVAERVEMSRFKERVLVPIEGYPCEGLVQPLASAVQAIDSALSGADRFLELGVDLATASGTMNLLWQTQELAADVIGR